MGGDRDFLHAPRKVEGGHEPEKEHILPLAREVAARDKAGVDRVLYGPPAAPPFHTSPYAGMAGATIACTNAVLAAEGSGLGSTMIGCVSKALARRKDFQAKCGLPGGHTPRLVLILGFPAVQFRRAVRRPLAAVRYFRAP